MGALLTAWKARVPERRQVRLTRPESEETTIDDNAASLAEVDALSEFIGYVGSAFDPTNTTHIRFGVRLLTFVLMDNGAATSEAAGKMEERLETHAKRVRFSNANARVMPDTDGGHAPSEDTDPSGRAPIPWADRTNLDGLTPARSTDPDS